MITVSLVSYKQILKTPLHAVVAIGLWSLPQALWIINWIVCAPGNNVNSQAFKYSYLLYFPISLVVFYVWILTTKSLSISSISLVAGFSYILISNSFLDSDNSNLFYNRFVESVFIIVITNIIFPLIFDKIALKNISITEIKIRAVIASYFLLLLVINTIPTIFEIILLVCGLITAKKMNTSNMLNTRNNILDKSIIFFIGFGSIYSNLSTDTYWRFNDNSTYLLISFLLCSILIQYLALVGYYWQQLGTLIIPQLIFSFWYNIGFQKTIFSLLITGLLCGEFYLRSKLQAQIKIKNISLSFYITICSMCVIFIFNAGIFDSGKNLVWSILIVSLFFGVFYSRLNLLFDNMWWWGVICVTILTFFFFDLTLKTEEYHQGFFLGPVIDLINGRSPLVDINAQYGVGIIYAIAMIFLYNIRLVSLENFSFICNVIDIIYVLCFFIILSKLIQNFTLSLLLIIFGLIIIRSNPYGEMIPQIFPSTGAFRYIWGILPIFITALKINRKWRVIWCSICLFIGSTWSLEAFVGVTISVLTSLSDMYVIRGRFIFRIFAGLTLFIILCCLIGQGILLMVTYLRSGELPNINIYLMYIKLYGSGFGWVSPSLHDAWSLFAFTYLGGFIIGMYMLFNIKNSQNHVDASIIISISVVGFLQASYYIYRAHTSNLYHILWMPYILMCFIVVTILKNFSKTHYLASTVVGYVSLFSVVAGEHIDKYVTQLRYSPFGVLASISGLISSRENEFEFRVDGIFPDQKRDLRDEELFALINKFPEGSEIALFIPEQYLLRARFGTTIKNKLKMSFAPQDEVSDIGRERAFESVSKIGVGEVIIVARDTLRDRGIMLPLLLELCQTRSGTIEYMSENVAEIKILGDYSNENDICRKLIE